MNINWPDSFEERFENYYLPSYLKNILVLCDEHIPYHHISSLDEAINYGIQKNIDGILLGGDVIDCYMLSVYQPDPRKRHFAQEIEAFIQFIKCLKQAFPKAEIFYKMGNHERRYEKIMIIKAPEFLDLPEFSFSNIIKSKELDIKLIGDQQIVYIGNLPFIHGHEIGLKYAMVNPARSLFLKTYKSSMVAHLHRTSHHTEQSLDGKIISCWSVGHLSDPHPRYRPINNWNHGIARIEKDEEGNFEVINFRILHNKLFRT